MKWIRFALPAVFAAVLLAVSAVPALAVGGQIPCSSHGHTGFVVYHHGRTHCRT